MIYPALDIAVVPRPVRRRDRAEAGGPCDGDGAGAESEALGRLECLRL